MTCALPALKALSLSWRNRPFRPFQASDARTQRPGWEWKGSPKDRGKRPSQYQGMGSIDGIFFCMFHTIILVEPDGIKMYQTSPKYLEPLIFWLDAVVSQGAARHGRGPMRNLGWSDTNPDRNWNICRKTRKLQPLRVNNAAFLDGLKEQVSYNEVAIPWNHQLEEKQGGSDEFPANESTNKNWLIELEMPGKSRDKGCLAQL